MVPLSTVSALHPKITVRCRSFGMIQCKGICPFGTFFCRGVTVPFLDIEEHKEHSNDYTDVNKDEHGFSLYWHVIILLP
jgi:hypothetical protein